ncbi:MAG: hypothetical protein V1900_02055 [Candidatus Aenigmatarchaeota archaeon]
MKGLEFLSMAMVGFLAAAVVLGWSMTQVGMQTSTAAKTPADEAASTMDKAKKSLSDSLMLASHQSSLEVAAAGGSLSGERVWICNGASTPPEPNEVRYSMSEKTKTIANSFIDAFNGKMDGVTATKYSCVKVFEPGAEKCGIRSSASCESWFNSAMGGTITVKGDEYRMLYDGDITADTISNRFWWMYYNLYNTVKSNIMQQTMTGALQCIPVPGPEQARNAINAAVTMLQGQFDSFVRCEVEYECGPGGTANCMNYPCPTAFDKNLCYEPGEIGLQGSNGARIAIKCTDTKFKIPSQEGTENLVWVIKATVAPTGTACGGGGGDAPNVVV